MLHDGLEQFDVAVTFLFFLTQYGHFAVACLQLVVAIEKAFGIKFTSREILSWDNVGDLIDSIEKKL